MLDLSRATLLGSAALALLLALCREYRGAAANRTPLGTAGSTPSVTSVAIGRIRAGRPPPDATRRARRIRGCGARSLSCTAQQRPEEPRMPAPRYRLIRGDF